MGPLFGGMRHGACGMRHGPGPGKLQPASKLTPLSITCKRFGPHGRSKNVLNDRIKCGAVWQHCSSLALAGPWLPGALHSIAFNATVWVAHSGCVQARVYKLVLLNAAHLYATCYILETSHCNASLSISPAAPSLVGVPRLLCSARRPYPFCCALPTGCRFSWPGSIACGCLWLSHKWDPWSLKRANFGRRWEHNANIAPRPPADQHKHRVLRRL